MDIPRLTRRTALFCQSLIVLLGLATLTFLLWEPHLEGRNAHATTFEIYGKDPFLAYVYVGSLPFFIAQYRAFALFGAFRQTGAFSPATLQALRAIQRCAFALIAFVAGGVVFILLRGDPDDRPAGIFMSLLVTLGATAIATTATLFARKLRPALQRRDGA